MALPLQHRGDGGIVGRADFPVLALCALGPPSGGVAHVLGRLRRRAQRTWQALTWGHAERGGRVECLGGLLGQGGDGTATVSPRRFGVAHQRHEDLALPAALTAQAAPDGVPLLLPRVGVGLQRRRAGGALLPGGMDEWEAFCGAV